MMKLETDDEVKLLLVQSMHRGTPIVRHVKNLHTFKTKKQPVPRNMKLPTKNSPNSAELTYEDRPDGDVGK